ncbi:N-acetylmuramoyl-L-alanine amidase, partial [hydrothermal vent metagenome]
GSAAGQVRATSVKVTGTDASARFVLELTEEVNFNVFALANPYRVIVDLPEIDFQFADQAGEGGTGLIRAFRFGLFSAGKSRIVIDVDAPVSIVEPYILPAIGNQPARLELGLKITSREDFMRDYALNGRQPAQGVAAAPPPRSIADLIAPRTEEGRPVIVLDPGHGGIDPGTRGNGKVLEKKIVLAFARKLRDELMATGQFEVRMTRDSDVFVPLRDRREFARQHQADLFISIHADSVRQSGVRGATVYTLSDDASDEVAAALASKENRADLVAGISENETSVVTDILLDLAQRETDIFSVEFAKTLVASLKRKVRLNRNPQRSGAFVVLKAHDVPSVLVELGYLSNTKDAGSLGSANWRDKAAVAVTDAVRRYFRTRLATRP